MYKYFFKRFIDCTLSVIGLIIFVIPIVIISISIKLDSRGPVVFKQKRLGKDQKIFEIYKFRTMVNHAYEMGGVAKRSDDARITKVGALLRRTSLDEILQMVNILKGEMAIIGPRPILPDEFEDYQSNKGYRRRFNALPGIFCTIDVVNRAPDRDLQFRMDAKYADHVNFLTDFRTFFGVIGVVLSGKDVYMEEADSSNSRKKK